MNGWFLRLVVGLLISIATLMAGWLCAFAQPHRIRVAVLSHWPPQYQLDDFRKPSGFAIDIIEPVAASAGLKLSYKVVETWEEACAALRNGEADLIPNIGITTDRQEWMAFTQPVETFPIVIFVRQSSLGIQSREDLKNHVVGTVQYNVGTRIMNMQDGVEHRVFLTVKEAFLELLAGRVDALIYPKPVLMKLALDAGLEDRIKVVGSPLLEIKRAIAVTKENSVLLKRLEPAIKNFIISKEYARIYAKWYGRPKPLWTPKRIMLAMAGLIFIIMLWHNFRVTKVNRRLNQSIADQKSAEAAYRASEMKYRLIVENQSDLTIKLDAEGRFRFASPSFCETFGENSKDFMSRKFINLVHPKDREKVKLAMQSLQVAPHDCRHEERAMTPNGWRWFSWSNRAIVDRDGRIKKIIAVGHDTTERKNAEIQLKESEEKFRAIFEQAADAVVLLNKRTLAMADYNAIAYQSLGYSREAFSRINLRGLVVPEPPDTTAVMIEKILKSQHRPVEAMLRDQSGHIRIFLMKHRPLAVNGGKYIIGIWHDITDRKKMEEHLVQSQKMEAIGTLAGGVAHDFNNILSIIIGNTELAVQDMPEDHAAKTRLREIQIACTRAKEVVRQLLTFSRREPENRTPLLLSPLVEESLKLLRASIPTSIEFRQHILATDLTLMADATQIHQILLNLCTNAAQAMDTDGGTIDVTLLSTALDRCAAQRFGIKAGAYAQIRVKDTGGGISSDTLEQIFDPYFTTKKAHEGTGMGLSIVHGIVTRHRGAVDVESRPGRGTVFRVFLPLSGKAKPSSAKAVEAVRVGNERILMVDDEAAIVLLGRDFLKQLGYRVQSFSYAPDALTAFKADPENFDLVITDMTMPKMTGAALITKILQIRPEIPVILCSGYNSKVDEKSLSALGVKTFLQKPYEMKSLADAIRQVLKDKIVHQDHH